MDQSRIFVLEDGDVLELSPNGGQVVETVPAGPIYLDGLSTRNTGSQVLSDRRTLSKDGVVVVILPLNHPDAASGHPVKPRIVSSGFMDPSETGQLFLELADGLGSLLAEEPTVALHQEDVKTKVRETAREFLSSKTSRQPMIIPVVVEV